MSRSAIRHLPRALTLLVAAAALSPVSSAVAATYQWDVNGATAGLGGTGAWNTTNTFWDLYGTAPDDGTATTTAYTFTNLDTAIFGGTAGTATLGSGVSVNGLTFNTDGYTITGNTLTLAGTTPTITTNSGTTIISSVIAGTSGYTKTGSGTLTLNNTGNTVTGAVIVNQGTLNLGTKAGGSSLTVNSGATVVTLNSNAIGYSTSCYTLNVNEGTFKLGVSGDGVWAMNTTLTGATMDSVSGANYSFGGGSSITVNASATTTTFTGLGIFKPRESQTSNNLNISVADGAAATDLRITTAVNLAGSNINLTGDGSTVISGNIDGSFGLAKAGNGTLTLSGANSYTGATTLSGGTLLISGSGTLGGVTYAGSITNNATLQYSSSANQTLSGNITGTGALIKDTGTGTLTLSGSNSYSGPTTISAGRLNLASATNASSITVNSGATLGGTGSTTGGLTTITGATLALNGTTPASGLSFGGAVNFAGTTSLVFDVTPTAIGSVSHTIVSYGSLTNGIANLTGPTGFRSSSITDDTVNKKVLFNYTTGTRTWNRTTPGNWDLLSTASWAEGDFMFATGDAVTFDNTATNGAVTLVGTLTPASVTFNNTAAGTTYTLSGSGSIGGITGLTKNNTGTVTLATANSYTGTTTINGGKLKLDTNTGTLANTSAIQINNGGTLEFYASTGTNKNSLGATIKTITVANGGTLLASTVNTMGYSAQTNYANVVLDGGTFTLTANQYINNLTLNATTGGTVNGAGTLYFYQETGNAITANATASIANNIAFYTNNHTMSVASGQTLTLGGTISTASGTTGLIKSGLGTLVLNGTNSFNGGLTINDGVVRMGSAGAVTTNKALTMSGTTGTLELNNNNLVVASLSSVATNTITNNASTAGTATLTINAAGTIANKFTDGTTGTLALRVTNSTGNFSLTNGSNTFSGGIVLTAGGTRMSTGTTITSGAYGTGAITVGESATDFAQIYPGGTQTLANDIIANTNLGTDRVGTFRVDVANFVLSGTLTANLAPMTFSTNGSGTMSATGKITGPNGLMLLSHGAGAANGSLVVTLNNTAENNDYAGDTTINHNAANGVDYTLALGRSNQIANGAGKGNVVINTNGTAIGKLSLNGYSDTINGLSGNGTVDGVSGTPTLTLGDGNATAAFSGDIKNSAGTLSLTKIGSGTQTLSGTNTYTGVTTLADGVLSVATIGNGGTAGNLGQASNAAANLVFDGGTLKYTGATATSDRAFTINAGKTATIETTNDLTLVGATGTATSGGLTKTGNGKLTLTGVNTYTGATTISAGKLALGASGSFDSSSTIVVGSTGSTGTELDLTAKSSFALLSGQTLKGIGTLNIGSGKTITVNAGATWAPGNSIGSNSVTGNLTLAGTTQIELGTAGATSHSDGTSDRTAVSGNLTLGGALSLSDNINANSQGSAGAGSYKIFTQSGTASGAFSTINALGSGSSVLHAVVDTSVAGSTYLNVYRLAAATAPGTTKALGNVRVGTALTGSDSITNSASSDGFSEQLKATVTGNGTGFTGVAGGSSGTVNYSLATTTAGAQSGSGTVTLGSTGAGTFADTTLSTTTVSLSGAAYDYAAAKYTGTTLDFGTVHAGATVSGQSVAFGNQTITNAAYQDALNVSASTGNAKVTATGFTGLGASTNGATTSNLTFTVNTASAGSLDSTASLTLVSNANGVSGLTNGTATTVGGGTIATTGQVYSGDMTYSGGAGTWNTHANWTDNNASGVHYAAGTDAGYTGVDKATFNGTGGTVSLDGQSANLNTIAFSGANGYTVAQGSGGALTLAGTNAAITAAGTHSITAPVTLGAATSVSVTGASDSLTINGAIDGAFALTKNGSGNLTLGSANSFNGLTVNAGKVTAGNANALGNGTVSITGGELDLGGIAVANTTISVTGGTVSGASGYAGQLNFGGAAGLNGTFAGIVDLGTDKTRAYSTTGLTVASTGTLQGQGTVTGNVTVNGHLNIGNSPGTLEVAGDVVLGSSSRSTFEIGGQTAGSFDVLSLSGTLTLDGTITVASYGSFNANTLTAGDSFDFIVGNIDASGFNVANDLKFGTGMALASGLQWDTSNFASTGVLSVTTAIPEPSTCGLLGAGALALATAVRRRRRAAR